MLGRLRSLMAACDMSGQARLHDSRVVVDCLLYFQSSRPAFRNRLGVLSAGGGVICLCQEDSSNKGKASKEEEAWARKHLPAGTPCYGRSGLTDAILRQSFDKVAPLLTV